MVVNNWIAANLLWITLGIAMVVVIYFVFTIIQAIRKKRRFVSQLNIILLILGLMFLIFLTYRASEIEGGDWGQIILMIGLVTITAAYASSTEKQADASVKMAEATEKSVTEMVRPVVSPSVAFGSSQDTDSGQYNIDTMYAEFKNIGRGPALHVEAKIRHADFGFEGPLPKTVLEVGETIQVNIPRSEQRAEESFELITKYQNMHGKWFCSRLTQDEHGQYHLEYGGLERKGYD